MGENHKSAVGAWGEKVAAWYLAQKGYTIKHQHYTSRFGEVDLIVEKDGCLVFVEVKARLGDGYGEPEQAVNWHKLKKLRRVILAYLSRNNITNYRIDVVAIMNLREKGKIKIRHHQNLSDTVGKLWF